MADEAKAILDRSISEKSVRVVGNLTEPRTYGVYRLNEQHKSTRRFCFGNHPIRMLELEKDFDDCKLEALFRAREDASSLASILNDS